MTIATRSRTSNAIKKTKRQESKSLEKHQNIPRNKCQIKKRQKSIEDIYYGRPGDKDATWEKGQKIEGKDPDEYRRCGRSGREMRYSHYGKKNHESLYNWHMDHVIPKARGGSNHISNLEPVNASKNCAMGSSMDDKDIESYFDEIREHCGIQDEVHPGLKWRRKNMIGKMFLVKASPRTIPELATILDYDYEKKSVLIAWKYTNWKKRLPLDGRLFEPISEGRPRRF
jgi:hypothetical protein